MNTQLQSFTYVLCAIHDSMERVLAEAQNIQDGLNDRSMTPAELKLYQHAQYLRHHIARWVDQDMLEMRAALQQMLTKDN